MKATGCNLLVIIIICLSLFGCGEGGSECDKLSKFVCYDKKFQKLKNSKYITDSDSDHDDVISCKWTENLVKSYNIDKSARPILNGVCASTNERLHKKLELMPSIF